MTAFISDRSCQSAISHQQWDSDTSYSCYTPTRLHADLLHPDYNLSAIFFVDCLCVCVCLYTHAFPHAHSTVCVCVYREFGTRS